ncbi:hypothetical protein G4V62_09865 [Bacillaceae bacterium SIJ1]|nr:hypothetical protein [Litoribacterium kuwaitense]NGP45243.1 hypothetical protein [Litoribacterium kuwaitense]
MAKSKAKKQRKKRIREGWRNPESNRSAYAFQDLRTRKTKTKRDYLYRSKHKTHSYSQEKDEFFYFAG